ncbi:MAG: CDP-diacylglycerol--glycerol-3-phosphate 3-phosphatidyltransferase [Magnetococcales bacterium]|nr:CDP-diacylglycerol--glycerol-3-phosphate 3-phosphatidyltransferase [Magnetococcales bacterium]
MLWNLPNTLTASRIVLIPFFVGCSYLPGRLGQILPALFFALAAITDWADGYLARRRGELTTFGKFFDPVADKLLVLSALILLVSLDQAPLIVVLIIMAREITIMALREFMSGQGGGVPVSWTGKWKTGFQMAAIIMLMLQGSLTISLVIPGLFCLYASALLTLLSGAQYMMRAWPSIRGQ